MTGSWDNYGKRYAMNIDSTSGPGFWTLTIKFDSSMPSGRHFYYYILDGYFESHDPNSPSIKEPTRQLTLNLLDFCPSPTSSRRPSPCSPTNSSKRSGGVYSLPSPLEAQEPFFPESPVRGPTHIVAPKPRNPMGAHKLTLDTNYDNRNSIIKFSRSSSPASTRSYSSCSTLSSRGSSPATPIYDSDYEVNEYDSEYEEYRREPSYKIDKDLAIRLERGLAFM